MLRRLTWILPAALFALAGAAKLIAPTGAPPANWATTHYPLMQRALGLVELAVAAGLLVPRSRSVARVAACVLLVLLSVFVAVHADDSYFVSQCGCFGALRFARTWPIDDFAVILIRNALLCGLVAAVRPRIALVLAPLVALATLFVAQTTVRIHVTRLVGAIAEGRRRSRLPGWTLPKFDLVDAVGRMTTTRALLPGDHVVFFTVTCPHCRRLAPAWEAFHQELGTRGARLVLIAAERGDVAGFKRTAGCASVPHFLLRNPLDSYRLGIGDVPQLLVLDERARVRFHGAQLTGGTFSLSADSSGIANRAWSLVAVEAFGPGVRLEAPPEWDGGIGLAEARDAAGGRLRLGIVRASGLPAHVLEFACGVDADGILKRIVPLTVSGYARVVDPSASFLRPLEGLSLEQAVQEAERRKDEATMKAPLWASARVMLRRLSQALSTP